MIRVQTVAQCDMPAATRHRNSSTGGRVGIGGCVRGDCAAHAVGAPRRQPSPVASIRLAAVSPCVVFDQIPNTVLLNLVPRSFFAQCVCSASRLLPPRLLSSQGACGSDGHGDLVHGSCSTRRRRAERARHKHAAIQPSHAQHRCEVRHAYCHLAGRRGA